MNNARLEEPDRGFERPPPKGAAELFNPKVVRRPASNNSKPNLQAQERFEKERERVRGEVVANAILVGPVSSMSIVDQVPDGSPAAVQDGVAFSS